MQVVSATGVAGVLELLELLAGQNLSFPSQKIRYFLAFFRLF